MGLTVSSEGDAGDVIYMASLLHGLGGQHTVLLQMSSRTKAKGEDGIASLCNLVVPLLESQQYIKEARRYREGDRVDWVSAKFRQQGHYSVGETLMEAHRKHLTATLGLGEGLRGQTKWLTAIPDRRTAGRVVVNRTGRYRNQHFPWAQVVRHYGHRLLFVGLQHEWKDVCGQFGYMDFMPTSNLLEVAQLIAGSALFIGNQSCAFACAEGLKHPRIQETNLEFPDCIFGGDSVQYVADGTVTLPDVDGSGELTLPSRAFDLSQVSLLYVPPGGWQFNSEESGYIMTSNLNTCVRDVRKRRARNGFPDVPVDEMERAVVAYNVLRVPRHFARDISVQGYSRVHAALKSAGIDKHPVIDLLCGNIKFTT